MKTLLFVLAFVLPFSAHALYVVKVEPKGSDVNHDLSEIEFVFNTDITELGSKISPELTSKITFEPPIDCELSFEGMDRIICKLNGSLNPGTVYRYNIQSGFPGLGQDRLGYKYEGSFTTSGLSIVSYQVDDVDDTLQINLSLNYSVKKASLSGKIQCDDKEFPVKFTETSNKGKDQKITVTPKDKIPHDQTCIFYFDRPLELTHFAVSDIPSQRVVIEKGITVSKNEGSMHADISCSEGYERVALFSHSIPEISCNFEGSIYLGLPFNNKMPIEQFIQIYPADEVKVIGAHRVKLEKFKPDTTYLVKIKKDAPLHNGFLERDIFFQVRSLSHAPSVNAVKSMGVIERHGPWQIPYAALNVKSVELKYSFFSTPEDISRINNLIVSSSNTTQSKVLPLDLKDNEKAILPLNVKSLIEGKEPVAGVFSGTLTYNEIEPKFQKVLKELSLKQHYYERGKSFHFGHLFTDIGLHVKKGTEHLLVWAFSLREGKPLEGVEILLGNEKVFTNKQGLAEIKNYSSNKFTIVAVLNGDISFLSSDHQWKSGISRYDFNLGSHYYRDNDGRTKNLIADVVAERPLYLPDEKVHLKIFVREKLPDSIALKKPGTHASVRIQDSRGENVLTKQVELSDFGTAAIEYQLPPAAPTGNYSLFLQVENGSVSITNAFKVEEFRKPEFKISLNPVQDGYKGGLTYFSGGPVKDLDGEAVVIFKKGELRISDPLISKFTFPAEVRRPHYYYYSKRQPTKAVKVLSRFEIGTDEKGEFFISRKESHGAVDEYGTMVVEAKFQDSAGGTLSNRVETRHNPYKHIPGIELGKWYYKAGETVNPRVIALDSDLKPSKGAPLRLTVNLIEHKYERRLGSGNYYYTDHRTEPKKIKDCSFKSDLSFKSCNVKLEEPGSYEFLLESSDERSLKPAKVTTYVLKEGSFIGYESYNHDRINLHAENNNIKIGDTLKLMAISPLPDAEALITFERDGILFSKQIPFKGNVINFEKVIDDEKLIPGFYASVVIIKGRTSEKVEGNLDLGKPAFKIGYTKIKVSNDKKRLAVNLTIGKDRYEPKQEVEVAVELKDANGKGLQGELALAVVDDAILSLSGAYVKNYDVLDTFYRLGGLGVENFQTLTQLIGRRTFGKKGANEGGGGGIELRSDFKNTAYWVAQVLTDEKGRHKFKFNAPDNLTTWRVIAIAVDRNHRFGFGENEFLVNKPLMVEPMLPNFLIQGDRFKGQVNISNRSGKKQKLKVSAHSETLKIQNKKQQVLLENDDRKPVFFMTTAEKAVSSDIAVSVKGDKVSDGFKLNIPVKNNVIKEVFAVHGVTVGKAVEIPLELSEKTIPGSQLLKVNYSTTILNGLDEVFKYVLSYPYGCWEQRLSKAYFLVQYEQFKPYISYRFQEKEKSIKQAVQELLNLAPEYQVASGGMRYYPGGGEHAEPYLSVFTAHAFQVMQEAGYTIDPKVTMNLNNYLKGLLNSDQGWYGYSDSGRGSNKAMLLEILTKNGVGGTKPHLNKLYSIKDTLDLFGLSFLMSALHAEKGYENEFKTVKNQLNSLGTTSGPYFQYKEPAKISDEAKRWNYTDTRSQCVVLQNIVATEPDRVKVSKLARLVMSRLKNGRWYNTQENMYCFEGLRRYVKAFESANSDQQLKVEVDGKKLAISTAKGEKSFSADASILGMTPRKVSLIPQKKDTFYYSTLLTFDVPAYIRGKTNDGFALSKVISRKKIVNGNTTFQTMEGNTLKLKRGDVLKIELTVNTPVNRYQVMLNDSLAACLEPINSQLATASVEDTGQINSGVSDESDDREWVTPYYRGTGFEYLDLRLDAAQFFSRTLKPGTYKVEYLVQVIAAGEFSLPESTIEEMYYPEIRGTDSGRKIIVEE